MDKVLLKKKYNNLIEYILPHLMPYFKLVWIKPSEMPTPSQYKNEDGNRFVKAFEKGYDISEDIRKNGMYTPFFLASHDKQIYITGGTHKMQNMQKNPRIKNKDFLALYYEDDQDVFFEQNLSPSIVLNIDNKIITFKRLHELFRFYGTVDCEVSSGLFNSNIKAHKIINDKEAFREYFNYDIIKYRGCLKTFVNEQNEEQQDGDWNFRGRQAGK
tara:strand:- start:2923 stop:3567 length:645 start_codon:yes stop_codon:yes gene_type:complete